MNHIVVLLRFHPQEVGDWILCKQEMTLVWVCLRSKFFCLSLLQKWHLLVSTFVSNQRKENVYICLHQDAVTSTSSNPPSVSRTQNERHKVVILFKLLIGISSTINRWPFIWTSVCNKCLCNSWQPVVTTGKKPDPSILLWNSKTGFGETVHFRLESKRPGSWIPQGKKQSSDSVDFLFCFWFSLF